MLINDNQYLSVIESIKTEISKAQYNAALQVNKELTFLYYHIGRIINEHKSWGNKFIDNLARDIKIAYPNSTGYSVRNLKYMAKFAAEYPDEEFVQTVSAQIPWYHNIALMVCDWCVNWVALNIFYKKIKQMKKLSTCERRITFLHREENSSKKE